MDRKFELPDDIISVNENIPPKDLAIISIPKMGKGTILGDMTKKYNALVWGLEKGGYEYIPARKLEIHTSDATTEWEAFENYINQRELLLSNKGKYDYLIIDGLSDLDNLSIIGGTLVYMDSIIGKGFNREGGIKGGKKLHYDHPDWKSVLTLPDGAGFFHTRSWFLNQIDLFKQISPYRIYAAHIADKYISENGKDKVTGSEIALTGQLKRIFAGRVTSMAKMVAEGTQRYLNFDVLNDSVLAGSRAPKLKGKILISDMKEDKLTTYWDSIYK